MDEIFVSVIIPTFNRAHVLERAIYSVLSQSYRHLELIVVDDASTDNTREILSKISDPRLRVVLHESNSGACAARNSGILAAKGMLVAFQDSDDEWLYGKLEKQVKEFFREGTDVVAVYCTKILYGRDKERLHGPRRAVCVPDPNETFLAGDLRSRLAEGNLVSTQTLLTSRAALIAIGGFDERLPNSQDWDLVIRLSELGKFGFVDEPLVNTYLQSDSISRLSSSAIFSQLMILNKMKKRKIDRSALADRLALIGYAYGKRGHPRLGQILLLRSLKDRPRSVRTYAKFLRNMFKTIF